MPSSTIEANERSRPRRIWAVVLLLVLICRLSLATLVYARPDLAIANDSDRYIPIANAILQGTAYAWNTDHPGELLNTVGYPLFLAGVFATFGSGAGDIALAQLLISGALTFGLYLMLSERIGARAAFLGALLLALDPLTALWSMTVLTESLFAVALGLAAGLLALSTHDRRWQTLVLAGLCVAMACLVKPFALLVAAIWAACIMFWRGKDNRGRAAKLSTGLRRAATFGIPILLLVSPWFVRNGLLWNCASLSSVDRVTMRDYIAAKVLAESRGLELGEAQADLQAADPGVCPTQTRRYWGIILANPAIYAKLHAAGTIPVLIATNFDRWLQYFGREYTLPDLWRPYMDGGWSGPARLMVGELARAPVAMATMLGLTAFQALLYLLALTGAIAALRRPEYQFRWITLTILGTIAVLILTPGQGGHERFRVPVQPMLALLISYGAVARAGFNPWRDAERGRSARK